MEEIKTSNFIEEFIVEDIAEGGQFSAHIAVSFSYRVCI